jgi:hypothetical protein
MDVYVMIFCLGEMPALFSPAVLGQLDQEEIEGAKKNCCCEKKHRHLFQDILIFFDHFCRPGPDGFLTEFIGNNVIVTGSFGGENGFL